MSSEIVTLKVEGMTCNSCAAGIGKSLQKAGFDKANASFISGEASFELPKNKTIDEARKTIERLGYSVKDDTELPETSGLSPIEKKFYFSLAFTLPLFLHMFVPESWFLNDPLVQLLLCLPVYAVGVFHFGRSAFGSIRAGMANMDVLIFIGSSAAFFYSLVGLILFWNSPLVHQYLFFETAATIITLVLLGNLLEHKAVTKTSSSIGELVKLQKTTSKILIKVGSREKIYETESKYVKAGDVVVLGVGDRIPVDGLVLENSADVNESMLTGESFLQHKQPGDKLYAGTLVEQGNIKMTATHAQKDSTLEKIINLVKQAQRDQPNIQKIGDKVSSVFVPTVVAISVLTFVLSYFVFSIGLQDSLMHSIAVLVISCPCAMGLATPTAVIAGIGRAAKSGILIKGGSTLEKFATAKTVIFDKTGTLTTGKFRLEILQNDLGDRSLELIKGLELNSSHPIARSILQELENTEAAKFTSTNELKGHGMRGITDSGEEVFFGKADDSTEADLELRVNDKIVFTCRISDELKADAQATIQYLTANNMETILLSGDSEEKCRQVAQSLNISRYYSRQLPDQKLQKITEESELHPIIMVGDGINDGPALSRAQVGVSLSGASDVAIESANVILLNPEEMESLTKAHKVAKHTYLTIKQNLFWALFYNVVAIPLAALGFLNPMLAALTMAFSDVIVIGNSLRLKVKKLN